MFGVHPLSLTSTYIIFNGSPSPASGSHFEQIESRDRYSQLPSSKRREDLQVSTVSASGVNLVNMLCFGCVGCGLRHGSQSAVHLKNDPRFSQKFVASNAVLDVGDPETHFHGIREYDFEVCPRICRVIKVYEVCSCFGVRAGGIKILSGRREESTEKDRRGF